MKAIQGGESKIDSIHPKYIASCFVLVFGLDYSKSLTAQHNCGLPLIDYITTQQAPESKRQRIKQLTQKFSSQKGASELYRQIVWLFSSKNIYRDFLFCWRQYKKKGRDWESNEPLRDRDSTGKKVTPHSVDQTLRDMDRRTPGYFKVFNHSFQVSNYSLD